MHEGNEVDSSDILPDEPMMVVLITTLFSKFPNNVLSMVCSRILPNVKVKMFCSWFSISVHFIFWTNKAFSIFYSSEFLPLSRIIWVIVVLGIKPTIATRILKTSARCSETCLVWFAWGQKNSFILGSFVFLGYSESGP